MFQGEISYKYAPQIGRRDNEIDIEIMNHQKYSSHRHRYWVTSERPSQRNPLLTTDVPDNFDEKNEVFSKRRVRITPHKKIQKFLTKGMKNGLVFCARRLKQAQTEITARERYKPTKSLTAKKHGRSTIEQQDRSRSCR